MECARVLLLTVFCSLALVVAGQDEASGAGSAPLSVRMYARSIVRIGQFYSFECWITNGDIFTDIKWFKDDVELQNDDSRIVIERLREDMLSLQFGRIEAQDAGVYKCVATGTSGVAEDSRHISVIESPRVWSPAKQFGIKGQTATIKCDHTWHPKPRLYWRKNRRTLPKNEKYIWGGEGNSDLQITNFEESDRGLYACLLTDLVTGDWLFYSINVDVVEPPIVESFIMMNPYPVTSGDDVTMMCVATGDPAPEYRFLKDDVAISEGVAGNILTVANVNADDEGIYTCSVRNKGGEAHSTLWLSVHDFIRLLSPAEQFGIKGQTATVKCDHTGHPNSRLYWRRNDLNGRILPKNEKYIWGSEGSSDLQITYLEESDKGEYVCEVLEPDNGVLFMINIDVVEPPIVESFIMMNPYPVTIGDDVTMMCVASGDPDPEYSFLKDDVAISEGVAGNVLTVANVNADDQGVYTCVVTNKGGEANSTLSLSVTVQPTPPVTPEVMSHIAQLQQRIQYLQAAVANLEDDGREPAIVAELLAESEKLTAQVNRLMAAGAVGGGPGGPWQGGPSRGHR